MKKIRTLYRMPIPGIRLYLPVHGESESLYKQLREQQTHSEDNLYPGIHEQSM